MKLPVVLLLVSFLTTTNKSHVLGLLVRFKAAKRFAEAIAGPGVTIQIATLTRGIYQQAGTFTDGKDSVGLSQGAMLATDDIGAAAILDRKFESGYDSGPGYAPLTALTGQKTYNAVVLEIRFTCPPDKQYVLSNYVWASVDYPNTIPKPVNNDVMAIFLNGVNATNNIATLNKKHISIGTFLSKNNKYYIDNFRLEYYEDDDDGYLKDDNWSEERPRSVYANGLSKPLRTEVVKGKKNVNVIRYALASGGDAYESSYIFVRENGLQCVAKPK